MFFDILDQTGNFQNIDNVDERTINLHHEVIIHFFLLGEDEEH